MVAHSELCHQSPRVREWSDRERKAELAILYWVVTLCEIQDTAGNMFLVENPVGATSWNQHSIQRVRNAPSVFEDISHLCMFGVKDPQSHQETRQVLDKQSRAVNNFSFDSARTNMFTDR